MKTYFMKIIITIAMFLYLLPIQSQEYETKAARSVGVYDVNYVLTQVEKRRIVLVGLITPEAVPFFQKALIDIPDPKEFLIDSIGGDAESAIKIAELTRQHNLTLIVDGRCFSACADMIFAAAKRKIVTEGSIVGIHEQTVNFQVNNEAKTVSGYEINKRLLASLDKSTAEKIKTIQTNLKTFYNTYWLNQSNFNAYHAYLARWKKFSPDEKANDFDRSENCQKIFMWILSREQLEEMGITGIEKFWYPKTSREIEKLYLDYRIKGRLFFGAQQNLKSVCDLKPKNVHIEDRAK